jgi:hypothetical protein
MSTTTQILFNSPALHSLKRDQLLKLCKIHAIKASGKNTDLIDRLKKHAATLPRDAPLSVAMRSEGIDENDSDRDNGEDENDVLTEGQAESALSHNDVAAGQMHRPSEQWEVMESIQEVEENSSQSTLSSLRTLSNSSTGEFGSGSSKGESPIFLLPPNANQAYFLSYKRKLFPQGLRNFPRTQTQHNLFNQIQTNFRNTT